MPGLFHHAESIAQNGFTIIEDVYAASEIESLINIIDKVDTSSPTFRKSKDLFAVRHFLKEIPGINDLIFNSCLYVVIKELFGDTYFVVKSIYFDKPEQSNWFVAYHQDLTISVNSKVDIPGYSSWTNKLNQFAVQPPLEILENNFTIRIHLDDTNESNGALKVIPGSHAKGIYRPESIDWTKETQANCNINKGGIMIMRPLLLHASDRSTNGRRRRVIHIEFSNSKLPKGINWAEAN